MNFEVNLKSEFQFLQIIQMIFGKLLKLQEIFIRNQMKMAKTSKKILYNRTILDFKNVYFNGNANNSGEKL